MSLKRYYGPKGSYLEEHKEYFSPEQLQKDVDFLIKSLKLKKRDKILDVACGNGRHTIELKKRGYNIDGLDFSDYLIEVAKKHAKQENLEINFFTQDIHKLDLKKKYNKIFLFFSDLRMIEPDETLKNITKIMEKNGMFLLDCDNVFRVIGYLRENPKAPYKFDFTKMELVVDKDHSNKGVRYYTFPELKRKFNDNNLFISSVYGNYDMEKLNINSRRVIIIGKKK
ncbi:MAG: class I SAM-dependent methyltransferase [bacterium]|nr:class I SAM-dependent methyltransferase [bacterium]